MTVRLIISSTVSLSRAALARGRQFRCEPQTNLRTAFRSIRSRSRAERRVRAEKREGEGLYIEAFEVLGLLGSNPFVRSRARQAVIV